MNEQKGFDLKSEFKRDTKRTAHYVFTFLKWIFISAIIGAVCGIVGFAFHYSVDFVTTLRTVHSFLVWLLPLAGILIVAVFRVTKTEDVGTEDVLSSVRGEKKVPWLLAPSIFFGTVLTHLCGGSAGREGAALQLGGSIGSQVGSAFKLDEKDMHIAILAGMSGVFSALFGTPLTATMFALEVISVGVVYYAALAPSLVSAFVAFFISKYFGAAPVSFSILNDASFDLKTVLRVVLLSALISLLSIFFCLSLNLIKRISKKFLKNSFLRIFVGGVIIVALSLVFSQKYCGAGMDTVKNAIEMGQSKWFDFLLKLLFTVITVGMGFKGGEIVPTFFIGATFGCFFGEALGLSPSFGAALGLVSLFCAMVNCPIASTFLAFEVFSPNCLPLFIISNVVSYVLSGYFGLYSSQKILYSKIRAEYININTWTKIE